MRTTSPSSASVTGIWQDSRESGWVTAAKLSMLASCEPGAGSPIFASQAGVDIDVAGGAGAFAAAIGVDAGDVVVDRALHHGLADRDSTVCGVPLCSMR